MVPFVYSGSTNSPIFLSQGSADAGVGGPEWPVPFATTIQNFRYFVSAVSLAGPGQVQIQMFRNDVNVGVITTITNADVGLGFSVNPNIAFATGDRLAVAMVQTIGPSGTITLSATLVCTP